MATIKPFSEDLIIRRIHLENPWWEAQTIPEVYSRWKPRLYFQLFYQLVTNLSVRRAVVLMGPRRVGKTVMLFHTIKHLIEQGIDPKKIIFISIDAPIYNNMGLEELFALSRKALQVDNTDGFYVIFDEVQYLKNWEVHLKSITDFYHGTRFLVSGSAAAALRLKSQESGAGRFSHFLLPSLTFQEFLNIKGVSEYVSQINVAWGKGFFVIDAVKDWDNFNEYFVEYINLGGYPEVIHNKSIQDDPGQFIRSDIIDKVLLRDLPSLYGIKDVQELNSLFNVIAYNSGNIFNLEKLSNESGVDKSTIRRYLEYLEAAFLIKRIYPVGINTKRFIRESQFKIYLTNPSMRCALFAPIQKNDDHFGQMVETAIIAQWLHRGDIPLHYASWTGGEVDMVMVNKKQKPAWAVEVKWSNPVNSVGKLRSLLKYINENGLSTALVTTIDKIEQLRIQGIPLTFIPASSYCHLIGRLSLEGKKMELTELGETSETKS